MVHSMEIYLVENPDIVDIFASFSDLESFIKGHVDISLPDLYKLEQLEPGDSINIDERNEKQGHAFYVTRVADSNDVTSFALKHCTEQFKEKLLQYNLDEPVFLYLNSEDDRAQFSVVFNAKEVNESLEWISSYTDELQFTRSNSWTEIETDPDIAIGHIQTFIKESTIGESILVQPNDPSSFWFIRIK